MSKKENILEMSARGDAPADIADELDTSESYVYKVRSEGNGKTADSDSSPSPSSSADSASDSNRNSKSQTAARDGAGDGADDRDDLSFGDDPEPKEYDCGNCETGVPYLEKHCPECGEKLYWSKIE